MTRAFAAERAILLKYNDGGVIDKGDRKIIEDLASVGLMRMGSTVQREGGSDMITILATASTTDLGKKVIKMGWVAKISRALKDFV